MVSISKIEDSKKVLKNWIIIIMEELNTFMIQDNEKWNDDDNICILKWPLEGRDQNAWNIRKILGIMKRSKKQHEAPWQAFYEQQYSNRHFRKGFHHTRKIKPGAFVFMSYLIWTTQSVQTEGLCHNWVSHQHLLTTASPSCP